MTNWDFRRGQVIDRGNSPSGHEPGGMLEITDEDDGNTEADWGVT